MKKTIGIILCLIIIAASGYYLLMQKKGAAAGRYARYLPREVVATVRLTHLNTVTDTFAGTALGRFLAKDTVHAIMAEMRAEPGLVAEYDALYDTVATVMKNPAFRAVFGDDSTLALLPPDRQAFARNPVESLRQSLVVVAATSASGALDLFGRLVMSSTVTKETIDGLELTRIALDQNQVIYGYVDQQTVLLAYAPGAIKACMAIEKTENTLEKAPLFKEIAAFWQPYPQEKIMSRGYLNTAGLAELLKASNQSDIKQSGEWMQGLDYLVSLSYATDQGLESRARSKYRYDQLHPLVKSAVDSASPANHSLHLLQEGSLAYNWSSSLRPEMLLKTLSAEEQDYRLADASVRKALGVSLDELGRAVGPQYGGVLHDVVKAALFPVPKMTLFVEIRDRKIAETALNGLRKKIAGYGLVQEQQETVAGNTLYSWPLLPDEAAQPALVLTDSMLYLASSKQLLKEILTGKAPANALAAPVAEQLGPELDKRVSRANFGCFVLYPARMDRRTGDMIDWVAGILATTKNISIARLSREWSQLMQSTELVVATTDLTKEQADWALTLKKAQPQPAGKTGQ